jgi:DNA-binding NarL/FixJ family response regulator
LKIIVLSVHDESSVCRSVMEAAADGFVLKRTLATELMSAVDAVLAGHTYVSPSTAQSVDPSKPVCEEYRLAKRHEHPNH